MTRHAFSSCLVVATLVALPGCKDDKPPTVDPDAATTATEGDDTGPTEPEPTEPSLPEQDPDPAEVAEALNAYILGNYEEVQGKLEPLVGTLTEDTQVRAHGMASAILGLALAENVPENAKGPADAALADAERLGDAEVEQFGKAAHAAYSIGVMDYATAQADLEAAVALEGAGKEVANLLLAQAVLNQAFDEEDKLAHPEKLDEAAKIYEAVLAAGSSDGIKGRAAEGLAGVASHKRDKGAACEQVKAAAGFYEAAGSSDYLKEGPSILGNKYKCK